MEWGHLVNMKIKKVIITLVILAPVLWIVLYFVGYYSFIFISWVNNPKIEATMRLSNDRYEILVYKKMSELRTTSTTITFIDNSEPTSLRYRLYHLFDNPYSIEHHLLVASNKKFIKAYFIDSSKVVIILNDDYITGIKLIQPDRVFIDFSENDESTNSIKLDTLIFDLSEYDKVKWY